jgi:uncharacterized repeat protein (TIGR03803 family)
MEVLMRKILQFSIVLGVVGLLQGPIFACAQTFHMLYSFKGGVDGSHPLGNLIKVGPYLYGTTRSGGGTGCGGAGCGTVFRINPSTGAESVVHAFAGGTDGAFPQAALHGVGGTLYGTAVSGGGTGCGGAGCGAVYRVNPANGAEAVIYSFTGAGDGSSPNIALTHVGTILYGNTSFGGLSGCFLGKGCGTIFSIDTSTGTLATLYKFSGLDGSNPYSALFYRTGLLYGTTYRGGSGTGCVEGYGCGTIFNYNISNGSLKTMHSFSPGGSDGASPQGAIVAVAGTLYATANLDGTAGCGGPYGCGTMFKMNPNTGALTALHEFTGGQDGYHPTTSLTNVSGILYGTSGGSVSINGGTLYSYNTTSGTFSTLYQFPTGMVGGFNPDSTLYPILTNFYGTTENGGDSGYGMVYELSIGP